MILGNGEFTEAFFADDSKTLIDSVWHDFDDDQHFSVMINVDLENKNYQKLLEKFNLQQIKKMTDEKRQSEQENFLTIVKDIAVNSGLIYDPENADVENRLKVDHIFELPEGEFGEEFLFNIKLKIFDMEEVMNSDNTELKTKLREATTPLECFYIAGRFLYE